MFVGTSRGKLHFKSPFVLWRPMVKKSNNIIIKVNVQLPMSTYCIFFLSKRPAPQDYGIRIMKGPFHYFVKVCKKLIATIATLYWASSCRKASNYQSLLKYTKLYVPQMCIKWLVTLNCFYHIIVIGTYKNPKCANYEEYKSLKNQMAPL